MKNRIILYPEYEGIKQDHTYSVSISDGYRKERIPVYSDIRHANHYSAYSMHGERDKRFCAFSFEGEVTLEISVNLPFSSYLIVPSDDPVESNFEGGVIRFSLDRPRQVLLRLDNDEDSYLAIFADAAETDIPDKNGDNVVVFNAENPAPAHIQRRRKAADGAFELDSDTSLFPEGTVFYFEAGWHDVSHLGLERDQQLYLAPGAVLCSRVQVSGGAENVKIFGRGLLRDGNDTRSHNSEGTFNYLLTVGNGWGEKHLRSRNTAVKDITLLDPASFSIVFMNTEYCDMDNVKVVAGEISTDGFSFWGGSSHINITNCFLTVADNMFVIGAGNLIDYIFCDNCVVGTSIKLFFPQGALGEHSIFKNIHVFRAHSFYESYGGYNGYLNAENVCAVDCPDTVFIQSGVCTGIMTKRFTLKNATLPDTAASRKIIISGNVNGKDVGGFEFDLENVWFGDRQIRELKSYPDTSHLYFKDESVGGTRVDISYNDSYKPVLPNKTYASHKPLRLYINMLPVLAPAAPEIIDGTPYIDGAYTAELYRLDAEYRGGILTLTDREKGESFSIPAADRGGRAAVPYDTFEKLLGLRAVYKEKEGAVTLTPRPFKGNLLVDFDFEHPRALRSWTTKNFTYVVRSEAGEGFGGGHAMRYGGDTRFSHGGEHGAYQYVLDQVLMYGAGTYRVSFMAKAPEASGGKICAGLSWHYSANILPENSAPLTGEWVRYSFDIPLKESELAISNKMAMAIITRNCDHVLIDDVEMVFVG